MSDQLLKPDAMDRFYQSMIERVPFEFGMSRRQFAQVLGAGLLIAASELPAGAQQAPRQRRGGGRGFGGGGPQPVSARVHIGKDGTITVLTGKVEVGQGSRAEITQAAAEELRVPADHIQLIMADTDLVPDDGITAGSGTTPRTIPAVRNGCAAARQILIDEAARHWGVEPAKIEVKDAKAIQPGGGKEISYADLAADEQAAKRLAQVPPAGVSVTPVKEWKVLGTPTPRPNGQDIVTGNHHYASDVTLPGTLHAKILRPPSYGAKLASIDLGPAKAKKDVIAVQDGQYVGVAAPTTYAAQQALAAIAETAKWETAPHPSSNELYDYLKQHAREDVKNPFTEKLSQAAKSLKQTYHIAYIQHAPMEPRAAVAQWEDGKLTVWTGSQNPFGVRGELMRAFNLPANKVRVIVPDTGGGFGGKHSGECAVEAARLAIAAKKPVSLRWTRQEEFTWAYFRPAGVIEMQGSVDPKGMLTSWYHVNINSGPSAVDTPYTVARKRTQFVPSEAPLRQGSYRGLASTANTFARECFMDELAAAAGIDPLTFRLSHLQENSRVRAALEEAVKRFDWASRSKQKQPNVGIGLACGTEKGSYVAACAEVEMHPDQKNFTVRRVVQTFECGAITNPANLLNQVEGAIMMGLGGALREEIRFEGGKIENASFWKYLVPRMADLPKLEVHLINRADLPSAGAGETPIIGIAPAIANAIFNATGVRVRSMPIRLT